MGKQALRFLALGFLISAIVLAGYRSFLYEPKSTSESSVGSETKEQSKEELSYKKKYEELLAETEVAELIEENSMSSDSSTNSESDKKPDASLESDVVKSTITVNDGDPSSVAVQQMKNQGIIENSTDFENFLEENNYITLIRPGTYELSSDMDFQQIANILMNR